MTEHQVRVRTSTGWQDLVRMGPTGPAGPAGVLLLEPDEEVPPGTPVGTIVYRKVE